MPLPQRPTALFSVPAAMAVAVACLVFSQPALAGDPLTSIKVNEVESEGLADFIELGNASATATDVSGLVLKDNDDARTLAIPAGTSIPPGGFLAVDTDVAGGFALDAADAARVFMPDGTTLIDGTSWVAHAATTFGRCPDRTGAFVTTAAVTKGAANACPAALATVPWPGSASVTTVDETGVLGADVSGLQDEGSGTATPGVLWAVDNGDGKLLRLLWDGTKWVRDTNNGWSTGKLVHYTSGAGKPDAEGVTLTDAGAAGGVFVASERNVANGTSSGVSRPSVLRYDVSGADAELTATREWNLTANLPAVAANSGIESVQWVPDSYLVGAGFVDQSTGLPYNPASYANHGTGLFFVGLEANGFVYAFAFNQTANTFNRVATFDGGLPLFGALHFDALTHQLWVVGDNNSDGRSRVFKVDTRSGPTKGSFVPVADYARPTGMANLNNEGFTITPASECVGGNRPVFWSDDGNTSSHVLRSGTIACSSPATDGADFNGDGFADLAVGVPDEDVGSVGDAGAVNVLYGGASGLAGASSQVWHQNSPSVSDSAETGDHFGAAIATGDFDNDGYDDLAVGVPGEDAAGGTPADGGIVHVLRGSAAGLTAAGSQTWSQNTTGIADTFELKDRFGASLAAGDLDGGGRADLVIGVPGEEADAGAVHVLFGTAAGLASAGSQFWGQNSAGIADAAEAGDKFGTAVAVGDINKDGRADLVIGAPSEDVGAGDDAGVLHVLLSGAGGPTATGSQLFNQSPGNAVESGDRFGAALALGDFNGDGRADLAAGAPGEDAGAVNGVGALSVLLGTDTGLSTVGNKFFTQNSAGVADDTEQDDGFASALAAGDFNNDGLADLAVGVPDEDLGAAGDAGVVHVLPGSASGPTATGSQLWSQDSSGIADAVEAGDRFGAGLVASRFMGAGAAGLAIGAPGEGVGAANEAGAVNAIYGGPGGLASAGNQVFSQQTTDVPDSSEPGDHFGAALG